MKKQLLTAVMGLVFLSGASFGADVKPSMQDEMPPIHMGDMKPKFDKEKMEKRKEEFMKKLDLTAEQREKAEKIHKEGMDEMKPIMEEMKKLREKAKEIRQKNKAEFESLLTPEQKQTLEKMHQERKAKMEKRFKDRISHKMEHNGHFKD